MADFFSKLFNFLKYNDTFKEPSAIEGRLRSIRGERERLEADSVRRREQAEERQQRQREEAEAERRRNEADPLWRYLHRGEIQSNFTSSHVARYWYDEDRLELWIQYLDGSTYTYENISQAEAKSLYDSISKGRWVWQNLRIKGTRLGARKEYHLAVSPPQGRKWEETHQTALAHATQVAAQSGAKSLTEKLGKFARKTPVTILK